MQAEARQPGREFCARAGQAHARGARASVCGEERPWIRAPRGPRGALLHRWARAWGPRPSPWAPGSPRGGRGAADGFCGHPAPGLPEVPSGCLTVAPAAGWGFLPSCGARWVPLHPPRPREPLCSWRPFQGLFPELRSFWDAFPIAPLS